MMLLNDGTLTSQAAGMDEVLDLRAALNERELELLELREQHVQLVARSQEARANWESALSSKDRAIQQLEEALSSRQRAIDQLLSVTPNAMEQEALLEKATKIAALEQALHEAHSTIGSLQRHTYDLTRERDLQESRLQARSHDDRRLEVLRQQLTAAFQEELAVSQDNCARFESTVAGLTSENQQLKGLLSERDAHINSLTSRHQELKAQVEDLRNRVLRDHQARAAGEASAAMGDAASLQQQQQQQQLVEVHMKLSQCSTRLQSKEAQAKKYKDAVRALQARLADADRAALEHARQCAVLQQELARVQQQQQQQPLQRASVGIDAGMLRLAGGESSEARAVALLQELRHQLHEKETALSRLLSEAEHTARDRSDLQGRLEEANRRADDAERKVRQLEGQVFDASRQADQAKHRHSEAQQQAEDLKRQMTSLQSRIDDFERKLQDARRQGERSDQRAERAERALRDAEMQLVEAERHSKQADTYTSGLERRLRDQEARVADVEKQAREADVRATDAEARAKSAEARALDAEKRSMESESLAVASERQCREADGQLADAVTRCREAERRRQELELQLQAAETGARQARLERDRDVMQLQRSLDTLQQGSQREVVDLQTQVDRLQRAKETAEVRTAGLEETVRQQEQLLTSMRSSSQSVPQLRLAYEERIRGLEETLLLRDKSISQLRESLAAADGDYKKSLQGLVADLEAKTIALAEAESRFAELEALMQRIVARSSLAGL